MESKKVIVIYGLGNGIDTLLKILKRLKNSKVYVLVHEESSAVIYRRLREKNRNGLKIIVLSERDIEVKSLKILVDIEPDLIIDCDELGQLSVFKKLVMFSVFNIKQCYDLITYK